MSAEREIFFKERRKYVRLDSVFPVEFRLVGLDGKTLLSDWIQGFTRNIGKGGICLEVNRLKPELAQTIKSRAVKLSLEIELPIMRRSIPVLANIWWVKDIPEQPDKHLVGLGYEIIDPRQNSRMVRYALARKFFTPVALILIFIFGIGFGINAYLNFKLLQGNRALVNQLISILQGSSVAQQKIKQITRDKGELQLKLQSLQQQIQSLQEEKENKKEEANKIDQFNSLIEKLNREKSVLQEQLINLQHNEIIVTDELLDLKKKKVGLEKTNFDKMYQWLKVHQNPRTGLVISFEGDGNLANWAFTYDQSLAIQVYTNFSDFERAKRILNFFEKKAKRQDGRFLNAYYASDGNPAEFMVHSGPNIWLGIAIMHYTRKTQDRTYLKLAEEIAGSIIDLQNEDADFGIRGGPAVNWYSTEHNLDAYAFFNMLYQVIGKEKYAQSRDRVLSWLATHTYDKTDIPIKRGKGDATIATDTYAWAIAAIGPQKLEELGMNPDRIMEFAEANCSVEVCYNRPEGRMVKIKGFDFAAQRNVGRGGVVSSEWTAQMVIAFKIMAEFYDKKNMAAKALAYQAKAEDYLATLSNMVISSPSPSGQGESCLPYATQDFVDTGHGWIAPKGINTGSVAGTAYALFAYYNYNPLKLEDAG